MAKFLKFFGLTLLLLGIYVFYIFYSTGYFRAIENTFEGEILDKIAVVGPEDLAISYQDSFLIISSDDRAARREGQQQQGGLYFLDLRSSNYEPIHLTEHFDQPFYPHGISLYRVDSAYYKLNVVNHIDGEHQIELFDLHGDSLVYRTSLKNELIKSPNDIIAIDSNRFYFTNDHFYLGGLGRMAEDYLGLKYTNVVFYDGDTYHEVANKIGYANGINWDPSRRLLWVAAPREFKIKAYQVNSDYSLTFLENILCGTGVDNIELDQGGNIWVGCHPNLLAFAAYADGKQPYAPSEIIKIDYRGKGDYEKEIVYLGDGKAISGSTVVCAFGNQLFVGNVMDAHVLVLQMQ